MTRRLLLPLLLLAALAGCVEYVDPVGLKLAADTRVNVALNLSNQRFAVCTADGPLQPVRPPGTATLCVDATLYPGRDKYGERTRLDSDTLWAMGVPVLPEIQPEDSARVYRASFRLPVSRLADTVYTVRLPRIAGVQLPVQELRWVAVEPLGPDTVRIAPGEGVQLPLQLPGAVSFPQPSYQQWTMTLTGAASTVQYFGQNRPRPVYEFPAGVLQTLGGTRYNAGFQWLQTINLGLSEQRVQVAAFFTEHLGWTVLTRETPTGG